MFRRWMRQGQQGNQLNAEQMALLVNANQLLKAGQSPPFYCGDYVAHPAAEVERWADQPTPSLSGDIVHR